MGEIQREMMLELTRTLNYILVTICRWFVLAMESIYYSTASSFSEQMSDLGKERAIHALYSQGHYCKFR